MLKRGDTLIEVMFSVGIFGAIAIGAIALMNDGLNTSQNTLETTMARQEIDAQIEALRFIHSAYASESKRDDSVYRPIWQSLTTNAYEATAETGGILLEDNEFYTRIVENDKSCGEIYSNGFPAKSFVINPRKLDSSTVGTDTVVYYDNPGTSAIRPASVYPRLLYGATTDESVLSDTTVENGNVAVHNNSTLTAAEGIWVTAIRSGTSIKDESGIERPDFYDFYINTCWNRSDGNGSTTINSILRLYNSDQIIFDSRTRISGYELIYDANGGTEAPETQRYEDVIYPRHTFAISNKEPKPPANGTYRFVGWATDPNRSTGTYGHRNGLLSSITVYQLKTKLYAIWEAPWAFTLNYELNGGSMASGYSASNRYPTSGGTYDNEHTFSIAPAPSRTNYEFLGWYDGDNKYTASTITIQRANPTRTLEARWRQHTHTLSYSTDSSNSVTDMPDSQTCKSGGSSCTIKISSTSPKRTGYTFKGWSDGSTTYQPDSNFTHNRPDETITLTAVWEQIKHNFIIHYATKTGDSGVTDLPSDTTCTKASTYCAMTLSNDVPKRAGYDFVGWAITNSQSAGALYAKGDTYSHTSPDSTVTLYAVWEVGSFTCNKQYRLQNADGTYPPSYTADGSDSIKKGNTCSYSKTVNYYITQSQTVTVNGATTISLDLPRTTYRLDVSFNHSQFGNVTINGNDITHNETFRWGERINLEAFFPDYYSYWWHTYVYRGSYTNIFVEWHQYSVEGSFESGEYTVIPIQSQNPNYWQGSAATAVYIMGKSSSYIDLTAKRIPATTDITAEICRRYASDQDVTLYNGYIIRYINGTCWGSPTDADGSFDTGMDSLCEQLLGEGWRLPTKSEVTRTAPIPNDTSIFTSNQISNWWTKTPTDNSYWWYDSNGAKHYSHYWVYYYNKVKKQFEFNRYSGAYEHAGVRCVKD